MKISLIGYMGSGKSTIGKQLAEQLKMKFLDLDEVISNHSQKTITELFKEKGEIQFRKLERETLLKTLQSEDDFVLAVGGGTPVYYDNMNQINHHTTSLYLRANPIQLAERLQEEKTTRPLIVHLKDEDMVEFVAKHLFERKNYYEKAHHTVNVNTKNVEEIIEHIIPLLNLQK